MNLRNIGLWNGFVNQNEVEPFKADIYETEEQNCIEMELPGYQKDNIVIDYNNGYLSVTAMQEEENRNYIHQERYYGEYSRSFYVGDVNESAIKASYMNGILKITYPKENHQPEIRRIIID